MGNTISLEKYSVAQPFNQDIWQLEAEKDYCKIYRNLETGQLCQEYIVELPSERIKEDIEIYEERLLMNHNNIVKVYYANYHRPSALCSTKDLLKVRTETIPYRIMQLPSISVPEALYLLQQSFAGFSQIAELYTHVRVEPDMIGISSDGKVKVWLNSNYSLCIPEDHSFFHQSIDLGTLNNAMIRQITEIVQIQTLGRKLPDWLKLNILKSLNFQEAIDVIHQFRNSQRLKMTSINLPGKIPNATVFYPEAAPIAMPTASLPLNISQVQSIKPPTHRPKKVSFPQPHYTKQKINPISVSKVQGYYVQNKPRNILRQSDPGFMPQQFPAEFVQSQLVRNISPGKNTRASIKNGQINKQLLPHHRVSAPSLKTIPKHSDPRLTSLPNHDNRDLKPIISSRPFISQSSQDIRPSPLIAVPQSRNFPKPSMKLETIPENHDYSITSHETPYYMEEPTLTPKGGQRGVSYSYSGSLNDPNSRGIPTITITPPPDTSSRIQSRLQLKEGTNSIGDHVTSSYTPVIINRAPSEVVQSTPVGVFSNIEYGHGVIRNRQPKIR